MEFEDYLGLLVVAAFVIFILLVFLVVIPGCERDEFEETIRVWTITDKYLKNDAYVLDLEMQYIYKEKIYTAKKAVLVEKDLYCAYNIGDIFDMTNIK